MSFLWEIREDDKYKIFSLKEKDIFLFIALPLLIPVLSYKLIVSIFPDVGGDILVLTLFLYVATIIIVPFFFPAMIKSGFWLFRNMWNGKQIIYKGGIKGILGTQKFEIWFEK